MFQQPTDSQMRYNSRHLPLGEGTNEESENLGVPMCSEGIRMLSSERASRCTPQEGCHSSREHRRGPTRHKTHATWLQPLKDVSAHVKSRDDGCTAAIACDLPACRYIFEVSVPLGHTQHLSLGFEPVIKRVAVYEPSFFVQLISAFADSAFQFSETHLAEIGVGGTQSNLHNLHLVLSYLLSKELLNHCEVDI